MYTVKYTHMENTLSLMAIFRDDPSMADRLSKATKEVEEYSTALNTAASSVQSQYSREIEEGTRQKQLLLENGKRSGKTEEQVLSEYGKYIPTVHTPILNLLFFLLRDGEKKDWLKVHKEINESVGSVNKDIEAVASSEELDRICERLVHEDEKFENVNEPQEMDRFIYGNMSHEMFVRIKKLKALSTSDNQNEAFTAFQLCNKLCKKYGLEFHKIPCNVE
jgi:hypothetical protein